MAYIQKDRVKETTTTNGTGAVTLAGAVAGFQAFSAVMSVADTCYYVIVSATGTDWETGTGTYSSASVLTRTTVLSSSNSGNAVSFTSGTKDVFMGPVANQVNDIAHGGTGATTAADARTNLGVSTGTVTSVSGAGTVSGLTLTGTVTSSGSLTLGGTLSAIPLATGVSGTLPVANGGTGVTTSTGTTNVVLSNSPTLVTPLANSLSAVPVVSGAGNSLILSAGTGVGVGAGGNVETKPGKQGSSGGDGRNYWRTSGSINTRPSGGWTANTSNVVAYSFISPNGHNTFNIGPDESNWSSGIATHYYNETMLSVRHPSESSSFNYIAAFYTSNANKTSILLGTSLTEAHVRAGFGAGSTPTDLVLSSVHSISPYYIENLRLKATGETVVSGFLTAPYVRTTSVTVATLPAAGTAGAGARAFVSDANATTFASVVAGGGANGVPVYSDGTNWRIG